MVDRKRDDADAVWRWAYRELQEPGSVETCPERETLAALIVGDELADREAVADHVVGCRRCSELTRDLADLHARARDEVPRLSRRPDFVIWSLGLAAVLVFGVAISLFIRRPLGADARSARGVEAVATAVTPADGSVLAEPPAQFAFEGDERTESYRVVLFDVESTTVWESPDVQAPVVDFPQDVRDRLTPGAYFWRVDGVAGLERRRSPLYRFTLVRRDPGA